MSLAVPLLIERGRSLIALMVRHGCSSCVGHAAVTAGDRRTVRSAQPAAAGRRPTARRASPADDQQDLAHRGHWLFQTAIAAVPRQLKTRAPVAIVSGT
jgi:hypothetical protein